MLSTTNCSQAVANLAGMAQTRGERLRAARKKHFASAREAARSLGVPPATYGAHERAESPGGRDYGPEEAKQYGRKFKVSAEYLLTGRRVDVSDLVEDDKPSTWKRTVPIVGYVGANSEAHTYAVPAGSLDDVEAPDGSTEETVAVEIKGDSLGALFDRWIVFYDDVRSPVTSDLYGKLCVVGLADERILIKKIRPRRDGRFDLLSNTDGTIENAAIEWAAKVKLMVPR